MSHFTVAVFTDDAKGEDFETALAPFHEFECTGLDDQYVQDMDVTEDARSEFEGRRNDDPKTFLEFVQDYYGYKSVLAGEGPDFEDTHKYGFIQLDPLGGVAKVINRTNPNAKWDWYVLGGRWQGMLRVKDGATPMIGRPGVFGDMDDAANAADSCLVKDLDFEGMRQKVVDERRARWEENWPELKAKIDKANDDELEKVLNHAKWIWGYDGSATVEEFVAKASPFGTYAVLKDGEWYEKGEMSWWCMASNEKDEDAWQAEFDKLLQEAANSDTMRISIVDCHI